MAYKKLDSYEQVQEGMNVSLNPECNITLDESFVRDITKNEFCVIGVTHDLEGRYLVTVCRKDGEMTARGLTSYRTWQALEVYLFDTPPINPWLRTLFL